MQTHKHRNIFSAYANSVTAVLQDPAPAFLTNGPCAALPPHGGIVSHTQEDIRFHLETKHLLRVGRASATTQGEFRHGHYFSLATSTVEKLNIMDIVTADVIVARCVSMLPTNDKDWEKCHPGRDYHLRPYFFGGSHFQNLRIDGKLIDCEIHDDFNHKQGYFLARKETEPCSLFKRCHPAPISIPQFGHVYLGEMQRYAAKVILTMLRVELGCPDNFRAEFGTVSTNNPDPPQTGSATS